MYERPKKHWLLTAIVLLLVVAGYLFYLDWQEIHREFTFAMLDVGQGDALFIETPSGTQLLVDAGPPRKIMGELKKLISPFDRSIDAIMITNPDADHISGFLEVLKNYKVGAVFEPGTVSDSRTYQNLEMEIKKKNIQDIIVSRGMKLDLGGGAVLQILFPDRDVSLWPINDGSIVAKLTYGDQSIMLTGDAPIKTEQIILKENTPEELKSTILKVGHHGSRSATGEEFAKAVAPEYALISVGKDNKYGHPHQEVLDLLNSLKAQILRTDLLGTIIMKSDGHMIEWKYER